jgi:hypothetical protein
MKRNLTKPNDTLTLRLGRLEASASGPIAVLVLAAAVVALVVVLAI